MVHRFKVRLGRDVGEGVGRSQSVIVAGVQPPPSFLPARSESGPRTPTRTGAKSTRGELTLLDGCEDRRTLPSGWLPGPAAPPGPPRATAAASAAVGQPPARPATRGAGRRHRGRPADTTRRTMPRTPRRPDRPPAWR